MRLSNEEDDVGSNPTEGVTGWAWLGRKGWSRPVISLDYLIIISYTFIVGKAHYATRKGVGNGALNLKPL